MDLFKYFNKFGQIESIKIHREGGYAFLLYRNRLGAMNLFEAGEIHTVKSFKIECRKVLNRDNLKTQTLPGQPHLDPLKQMPQTLASKDALNRVPLGLHKASDRSLLNTTSNSSIKSGSGKPLRLKGQYFDPNDTSTTLNTPSNRQDTTANESMSGFAGSDTTGSFLAYPSKDPCDQDFAAAFRKGSPTIVDSGNLLEASILDDDDMVLRPQLDVLAIQEQLAMKKNLNKPDNYSWQQMIEADDYDSIALWSNPDQQANQPK